MSASSYLSAVVALFGLYTNGPTLQGAYEALRSVHFCVQERQNVFVPPVDPVERRPAPRVSLAIEDEFGFEDEEDGGDVAEPGDAIMVSHSCPSLQASGLSPLRQRVVEYAYSDESNLAYLGAYLAAAHAGWCWYCCCPRRSHEAEGRSRGVRVYSVRAAPAW